MAENGIEVHEIVKRYNGVEVLHSVSMSFAYGQVHALMGANGAGKSTLMKIMAGLTGPDSGYIKKDGVVLDNSSPKKALENGFAIIHQELSYVPEMTVAENIFLGREPLKKGNIDRTKMIKMTKDFFELLEVEIDPKAKMKDLRAASRQIVEITKAVSLDSSVLIMDEPTSSLTFHETKALFQLIKTLTFQGKCIIYISHKIEEIYQICDTITVLRDGNYVGNWRIHELKEADLVKEMVGSSAVRPHDTHRHRSEEVLFEAHGLSRRGEFQDISFQVRCGEILGIGGLVGSGRTETMQAIFGLQKMDAGALFLCGRKAKIKSPADAIRCGIAYVPEDRKNQGLVLLMSVGQNLSLPSLKVLYAKGMFLKREKQMVKELIENLRIKASKSSQSIGTLSGGNQQKVVLGKWYARNPRLLILDEPTRGIDIAAKSEIYSLMQQFAAEGNAVIMVSSEVEELIEMADRIIVYHNGTISGAVEKEDFSKELIMYYAMGIVGGDFG